mmetsp:Transcript_16531/g.40709  ORF Transcript_16531/g.40709 Transcript_16531/m.40709 type:complete len:88 (-) Transcript_16531:554-817(-)
MANDLNRSLIPFVVMCIFKVSSEIESRRETCLTPRATKLSLVAVNVSRVPVHVASRRKSQMAYFALERPNFAVRASDVSFKELLELK